MMPAALAEMAARGANAVIFTPTWTLQVNRPLPVLGLDPTQGPVASEAGATTLILGGPEIAPALPDGLLPDGTPSGAPADADARWRTLIGGGRTGFSGRVGFGADLGG